jgi:hypothetical protein
VGRADLGGDLYSDGMFAPGGLLLVLLIIGLGLLVQYAVIRLAVRHGIQDAWRDRASKPNRL